MLNAARDLWRKNRFLFTAFIVALVVTAFFAVRLLVFSLYWADPAHHDQPLEGWMTPRYIAHSYDLPPDVVRDLLEIEPAPADGKRRTLDDIVKSSDLTMDTIQRRVDQARRARGSDGE